MITEAGALLDLQTQKPSDGSMYHSGDQYSANQPPNQVVPHTYQKYKPEDVDRLGSKLEQMKMDKHNHMNSLRELQKHN
tara:strand:+ start:88 stop:324 length:237 start_codon:yes stop_codon:yes gene_type:complete